MRKVILLILFSLPYITSAQTFLNNPDYIYGEGRGSTLEEADKRALEGLVTTLCVDVRVNTSLDLNDHNGRVNKEYDTNINTKSNINLRGVRQHIDNTYTEGYRVFRYFNATEYVLMRKEKAVSYLKLAKENYYHSQVSGTVNLTLGYYYLAYKELNDDVMSFLDNDNDVEKARILHNIKSLLQDIKIHYRPASFYDYDWSDIENKATRPSYDPIHLHVSVYYKGPLMYLFDFEYWDGVKWSDDYKWNDAGDIAEINCTTSIPRDIKDLKYRIKFQTVNEDGEKIILPVPDNFYMIKVIEYFNPRRWIESDIKRGFY